MNTPDHPPATARATVAVIGAGASGIMTTMRLLHHHRARGRGRLTVHLLDRQQRPGLGVAYSTPLPQHVLNMQAKTMSLYPDDPDHFLRALPALLAEDRGLAPGPTSGPESLADSYVPRRVYGAYLERCLREALAAATTGGIRVDFLRHEVARLHPGPSGLRLESTDGTLLPTRYTHAVICVGDLPPTSYRALIGHPHYAPTPWDPDFYHRIPPHLSVGVIGTGLTAVDTLLALRAHGHQGPLYAFARRRGWPGVQPATLRPHQPDHLTADAVRALGTDVPLARFAHLLRAELTERIGPDELNALLAADRKDPQDTLARDIARAESERPHWYEVLDATSPLAPEIWHRTRFRDKSRFLRRSMAVWAVHRHLMPLDNARFLHTLLAEGRLRTLDGTRAVTSASDGGFDVLRRTPAGEVLHHTDFLVNASGPGTSAWSLESPLVKDCLDRGLLRPHPLGGIDVDYATLRARRRDGAHDTRLLFVGPLTSGVHFYTNAIETNLTNADAAARWITTHPDGATPH
ncbi:putative NAD(P)/FAD-binding protein YdhS [Kitasatospora sp. SolWspMP-SS2h]|uniref:FAD/NAD(P)-binding protein n=1 Tax=Kitasatospora sp. SolWspMP-SS2h TaxID=1305729 RepID=UPI000DB99E0D|nr:FAD/NAD(P)-binding protein [Kitasatospora sp. SolWspMP-SS2h]RAJ29845.1 putative NAD(P)/FAD-binding protein YdhS [Kitasatospora sp. SolWspMP-SS2h]